MSPIDTLRAWDEAKDRRRADPENDQLVREELEAELAHLSRVGVEIRPSSWYGRHKSLIQGVGGSVLAIIVALALYFAYETNKDQNSQGNELRVLVQSSPCAPTKEHPNSPRDPAACKRNFAQGIKNLTPEQSCFILERGASLIKIGGNPIPRVTCIRGVEPPPRVRQNRLPPGSDPGTEPGEAASGTAQNPGEAASGGDETGAVGGGGRGAQNNGGDQEPEGDGGDTPTTNPPSDGGGGVEQPAGGGADLGGPGGGADPNNVVDGVTNGLGEAVGDTVQGTCSALDRLAGLCH